VLPRSRPIVWLVLIVAVVLAGCSGSVPADDLAGTAESEAPPETTATTSSVQTEANGSLEVHMINVGQSVSTLIISPSGETMLIDTGHYHDDGEFVLQYLRAHNIERIDHLVVSHSDADHIGGNAAVIEYFETEANGIGAIYDPGIAASTQTYESYLDAVENHEVTLYETREGDSIDFVGVDVQVLGPPEPYLDNEERNENSIVLKLSYGQTSFLMTGDAEGDQEEYLVSRYGQQLNTTVLKAGHHGSSSSTSEQLLDAANPQAVVISSAYDSQYGHPTEEMLSRLAEREIPAYWTATHGDIVLVSDGGDVSIQTQQAAPTHSESLRDGEPIEPGTTGDLSERATIDGGVDLSTQTTVATDGGTLAGQLVIDEVHADAEGMESENLNDEYIVFSNEDETELDLAGWTVEDEAGATYTFPDDFSLAAGESVTLHTGSGTNTATDLYWGFGSPIWNNGGDTVTVRNAQGDIVSEVTYE